MGQPVAGHLASGRGISRSEDWINWCEGGAVGLISRRVGGVGSSGVMAGGQPAHGRATARWVGGPTPGRAAGLWGSRRTGRTE